MPAFYLSSPEFCKKLLTEKVTGINFCVINTVAVFARVLVRSLVNKLVRS